MRPPTFTLVFTGLKKIHKNICINVYITSTKENDSSSKTPAKCIYTESTTVPFPSSELGPPPPPISQASVSPPPEPKGKEHNRLRVGRGSQFGRLEKKPRPPACEGGGGPISDDWRKSLARLRVRGWWGSQFGRLEKKPIALCLLCENPYHQYMALCAPQLTEAAWCGTGE
jgi:hypothetical protein